MTSTLLDDRTLIPDHFGESPIPMPEQFGQLPLPVVDLANVEPIPVPELAILPPQRRQRWARWSIPLSVSGLAVSLLTAASQQHLDPGLWGLPGSVLPTWYIGIALVLAGIGTARRSDGLQIGIAVTALVLVLTATPAIVYDIPRLPSTRSTWASPTSSCTSVRSIPTSTSIRPGLASFRQRRG